MKFGLYNLLNESTKLEQRSSDKEKQILLPYVDKFLKDNDIVLKGDQKTEFENVYVLCFDVILEHYISLFNKEKKGGMRRAQQAFNAVLTYNPPEILYRRLGGTFFGLALSLAIFLYLLHILFNDIGVNLTYEDIFRERNYGGNYDLGNMPMDEGGNAIALIQEQGDVGFQLALNSMFQRTLVEETREDLVIDGVGNLANLNTLLAYFTSTLPSEIQYRIDDIAIQAESNMRREGNQIIREFGNEGLNFLREQMNDVINEEGEVGIGAWFILFNPLQFIANIRGDASRRIRDVGEDISFIIQQRIDAVIRGNRLGMIRGVRDYLINMYRMSFAIGVQGTYLLRYLYAYMRRLREPNQVIQVVDGGSKRKRKNKRSKGKSLRKKQSRKKTKKTKKRSKSKK